MKRLFRLAMITTVVISTLGTFGAALSPVAAAPARASTPALAALMPANVDLYAELNLSKLTDALTTLNGVFGASDTAGTPNAPMNIDQLGNQLGIGLNAVDKQLSQLLGHPATLSGDVLNWLNQIAVGIPVSDNMLQNPAMTKGTPPLLLAGSVKDEAAADKFIADVLAGITKAGLSFPKTSVQINGQTATRYDNPLLGLSLVRWPGYVLIGMDMVINSLVSPNGGSPASLATDPKFQQTIALLNIEGNALNVYASPRALAYLALRSAANTAKKMPQMPAAPDAAATMSATAAAEPTMSATAASTMSAADLTHMTDALKALNGLAMGTRMVNKSFVLEIALSVNPDAMKAMASQMNGIDLTQLMAASSKNNTVSGKLTAQIPSKAAALIEGHDLTRIYTTVRGVLTLLNSQSAIPGVNAAQELQIGQAAGTLASFEKTLKDQFGLDINSDVIAPLAGDFAVYAYLDPNDTTIKVKAGQPPLVPALLIDTTDAAKAKAFADKLAAGLPKAANITPEKISDGLYTLTAGKGDSEMKLAYGVSGNTFLLTTGSALSTVTGAIGGSDSLDGSATWKNAKALLPASYNAVLYLDVNAFSPYMKNMSTAGSQANNKMGQALLNQLDSALIYSTTPDANSAVITLALTLK